MAIQIDQVYAYLVNEEDARVCKELDEKACKEVPGNFFLILLSQFISKLADACASAKIVLPWLLTNTGAPAFFVGLLVPIRESGSLIPQLLVGGFIRRFAIRKWFFVLGSALQALCVLGMAWVGVSLSGMNAGISIICLLVLFSLSRGICSVASKDVLGKTIPKSRRGRVTGYSASAAGFLTLGIALVLFFDLLENDAHYILLLILAAICWLLSAISYASISEYSGETDGGGNGFSSAFKSMSILKTDAHFRHFITVRALLMSSGLAAPYFILLATQQAQTSSDGNVWTQLATFLGISGIASLVSGSFWGRFADTSSRNLLIVCSASATILCAIASYVSFTDFTLGFWVPVGLFFLLSITHQGVRLGRKTYVVDMAEGNRRTDFVAVGNTLIGFLLLAIGLISAITAQFSTTAVLIFFTVSSLLGCLLSKSLPEV